MHSKPSVKIRTTSPEVFKKIAGMIDASTIMTPRFEFEYCKPKDLLEERLRVMEDREFDVIPMLQGKDLETGRITDYLDQETMKQKIGEGYRYCKNASREIGEEDLVKEDLRVEDVMSKFAYRTDKPKVPFFVVSSDQKIVGLITLADLDKMAIKMYLFALISELELSLLKIISKRYKELKEICTCKYCLNRRQAREGRKKSQKPLSKDSLEEYYYLYTKELMHVIIKSDIRGQIQKRAKRVLTLSDCDDIAKLRNTVAHPKPLVSGKFPINRLIKVRKLIKDLIFACKTCMSLY